MDALSQLHFNIVETEEEILILDKKRRLATNILNWHVACPNCDNKFDTEIENKIHFHVNHKTV